jgi:hypothetical protein
MHPARRRLVFLLAAIAAVLLALAAGHGGVGGSRSCGGTRVGASHPETIPTVGTNRPVSAGEGRCRDSAQASSRRVRVLPQKKAQAGRDVGLPYAAAWAR